MTDEQLKEAVEYFKEHYQQNGTSKSKFEVYICGYFHTYPKHARFIIEEMENIGIISVSKGNVCVK